MRCSSSAPLARAKTRPDLLSKRVSSREQTWVNSRECRSQFTTFRPGTCMMSIDTGYNLYVNYGEHLLIVSLGVSTALLNGDASAFWLRLSAFDNLAHVALGTKQQAVFDGMNKLAKKHAEQLQRTLNDKPMHSKVQKVMLGAIADPKSNTIMYLASAEVKEIDKMKRQTQAPISTLTQVTSPTTIRHENRVAGTGSRWKSILGLSMQALAAG